MRFPDSGLKPHQSKFILTGVVALIIGAIAFLSPSRASAYANVQACSPSYFNRQLNTYFRHNGTAAPTAPGEDAWNRITAGYPAVIFSTNPEAENPSFQLRVYNDSDGGKVLLYPSGYTNPEYLMRLEGVKGFMAATGVTTDNGVTIDWDWSEDDTPPFGSYFAPSDNWTTPPGDQNLWPDNTTDCILAIGGRISSPPGVDIPFSDFSAIDENVPPVDHGWNVVEWLREFWSWLTKLPQFIASLFIPSSSTINAIFGDVSSFFDEKLGVLLFPFEFIADFFSLITGIGISNEFDDFANPYNNCASAAPNLQTSAWNFGSFFGGQVHLNGCALQAVMPALWTVLTIMARGLLIYALVNYLLSAHRRIIQKS